MLLLKSKFTTSVSFVKLHLGHAIFFFPTDGMMLTLVCKGYSRHSADGLCLPDTLLWHLLLFLASDSQCTQLLQWPALGIHTASRASPSTNHGQFHNSMLSVRNLPMNTLQWYPQRQTSCKFQRMALQHTMVAGTLSWMFYLPLIGGGYSCYVL